LLLFSFQSSDCHHGRSVSSSRLNFFDIELLRYVAEGKPGNVMVSPASVKSTLAMLLEGAKGVTATEIRNALRLSTDADDRKVELIKYLNALNLKETSTVLQSASGAFVSKKLALNKDFEAAIKRDFSSEMTKTDFDDPKKALDLINTWVSQKTHGLIPTIVEPGNANEIRYLILANALYFKSTWKYAFNPRHTRADCFYRSEACEKVTMMELETDLPYAYVDDLRAHALELPYEGGRYSMIILVPLDREGCEALIRDLPFLSLAQIHDLMHPTEVTLVMPKFTVSYNADLVEPLSKMHMSSLFSSKSNLTGIFDGSTASVSSFQHKVFMSVDEVGTVAAAVSAAAVVPLSFSGVDIRVDKPFVFFIRDNDLGIVLFEGKIEEPTPFVEPVKPQANVVPVKTEQAPVLSLKPAAFVEPSKPLANGPKEMLNLQKPNFDSSKPVELTTTVKPTGFFDSVKNFFG
ncbi:Serpin-11, partial [Operophtera brumata]